jgi:hypothetical protein
MFVLLPLTSLTASPVVAVVALVVGLYAVKVSLPEVK